MDILDILIAKKQSFTAETEKLVNNAKKAMTDANKVISRVTAIEQDVTDARTAAEASASQAAAASEDFAEMKADITAAAASLVDEAVAGLELDANVSVEDNDTSAAKTKQLVTDQSTYTIMKNYTTTGNNEDGSMTQKAITEKLNLGIANKGKIAIIGDDGFITYGTLKESEINQGGSTPTPTPTPASTILGVIIDYENKTFTRCENAVGLTPGEDFNQFSMYGGRKRCNVNAAGRITAWYGDSNYADDGSNGDVMVYQPKFYYRRTINKSVNNTVGKIVRKETLLISETAQTGFKLHPRFKSTSGETLEYILLPAYEGSTYDVSISSFNRNDSGDIDYNNDYLVSCANSKPTTNITISDAETLARNKGANWHINDMGVESINQMLFMVEYAAMNGQNAIGAGISKTSNMMNTGLTATLGNNSGEAPLTSNVGYRAVSYRGYENWWGNAWSFVGGIGIKGDSNSNLGIPYIATDFNYDPENLTNYANVGFNISKVSSWVSAMGYGSETYDWIYLPAECNGANSAIPVGDNFWTMTNFTVNSIIGCGGTYSFDTYDGPFYYGCDRPHNYSSNSYNARVMYIPTKNSTYTANYNDWLAKMGG